MVPMVAADDLPALGIDHIDQTSDLIPGDQVSKLLVLHCFLQLFGDLPLKLPRLTFVPQVITCREKIDDQKEVASGPEYKS